MPDQHKKTGFGVRWLEAYGAKVIANNYDIIPIVPGQKNPPFKNWSAIKSSPAKLREWLQGNGGNQGIGILTTTTPAIDIDVRDEDVAERIEQWIYENIPGSETALIRYGEKPKRLLLFRTKDPFTKIQTPQYVGEFNQEHKVEVLGEGQQFVAFNVHPKTARPFEWVDDVSPMNYPREKLPLLTRKDAARLIDWVANTVAVDEKWQVKKKRPTERQINPGTSSRGQIDYSNPDVNQTEPVYDIPRKELRKMVKTLVDNDWFDIDDYSDWAEKLGFACYHQFDGDSYGFELWCELSEASPKFDYEASKKKWPSFNENRYRGAPYTFHSIVHDYQKFKAQEGRELAKALREEFRVAPDMETWADIERRLIAAPIELLDRLPVISTARAAYERLTGDKLTPSKAEKRMMYVPDEIEAMPEWLEDWVFLQTENKFVSKTYKFGLNPDAFDFSFKPNAMTEADRINGHRTATRLPTQLASEVFEIERVSRMQYMPTEKEVIFTNHRGETALNTYSEITIPKVPETLSKINLRDIERVKAHFTHLLPNKKEARMLFDWMAYIVQNPGVPPKYATVLKGTQGDGKTFLAELLAATMGVEHVRMLSHDSFETNFTGWAVGQCVNVVEEIRLLGESRFNILNKIKPYVTNGRITYTAKYKDEDTVENTTAYLLLTNYDDALPIDDSDRRYMVLFTQWYTRAQLEAFKRDNPDYYANLFAALLRSPGALRKMFLEHEFDDEFNPEDFAPMTDARSEMIFNTTPDYIKALNDFITDDNIPLISGQMFDGGVLVSELNAAGIQYPLDARRFKGEMERAGYSAMGRVRVLPGKGGDNRAQLWLHNSVRSQYVELHEGKVKVKTSKVKQYFSQRLSDLRTVDSRIQESDAVKRLTQEDDDEL